MTMRDDHRKSPRNSTHLLRKLNPHCAVALEAAANPLQAITDAPNLLRAANAWPLLSVSAITSESPVISQAELLEAIHPTLVAHFQPALPARFQTLVYRPLDAAALASIVRLKLAKVAERLRHQYDIALTLDDALTDSLAQLCLARGSGARNVDAFLNQRILPAVSRELLSRMAKGSTSEGSPRGIPAGILLSMSPKGTSFDQRKSLWDGAPLEGSLVIDVVDHDDVRADHRPSGFRQHLRDQTMPAGPSLYDRLLGHIDGEPLSAHDDKTLEVLSVQQNIRRILNTRAGALKHLPDFGLPDLTNVFKALPASSHLLKKEMEATLLKYEPRIRAIDIDIIDNDDPGVTVSYVMTCHLKKAGLVRFGTYFEPPGRMRIERRTETK